jgi:hypothetical protein
MYKIIKKNQKNITTLQHITTLHHTLPKYTLLHLSTLHSLTFTLHYPLIWRNPFMFPTISLHLFHLTYQPFTSLYFAIRIYNSLPFTSLPFTFHRLLFPSLVYISLTLVLKICALEWEVPIAPLGSWSPT